MASYRIPGPLCSTTSEPIDAGTMCRSASHPPGPIGMNPPPISFSQFGTEDDGLEIVLTPIQLAAIFSNGTIEHHGSVEQRFWGAATAIGGALELVGAAALLLAPEPTVLTKVAGVALGAHGADTATAGFRQVYSGRSEATVTSEVARSAALAFGVDQKNANLIGLTVDIAIPAMLGIAGAVRILAVRRGAISLVTEEALGGHTIARHVGRTEAELRSRLFINKRIRAATTFKSLAEAERTVSSALRSNQIAITSWSKSATIGATKAFNYDAGRFIGLGIARGSNFTQQVTRVTIVLRKIQANGREYFVLTAYPKF